MTLEDILAQLDRPDVMVEQLLDQCRSPDLSLWEAHPELYLRFVKRLIEQGHPSRALDLAHEGEQYLKDDLRLRYQLALAAARGGNPGYAEVLLAPLLEKEAELSGEKSSDWNVALRVDVIALKGRILKDRSDREPHLAGESAAWYELAARVPGADDLSDRSSFPLINAATMWRLAGDEEKSRQIAEDVVRRIGPLAEKRAVAGNLWPAATLGEALLLLGEYRDSATWYLRAVEVANSRGDLGSLVAIRSNLRRLQKAGATSDPKFLDEYIGTVVVFSGHMIDSPDRLEKNRAARFPNHEPLVDAVAEAIRDQLEKLNAKVGYCSLAAGGDILFAEAMLDRGAELHVVLPFAQPDFLRMSVDFGQHGANWRRWRMRFDGIVDRLEKISKTRVRYATSEPYLDSNGLFGFTNSILQGLAVLRARSRTTVPTALVLLDESDSGEAGGTAEFLGDWSAAGYPSSKIDMADLRQRHPASDTPSEPVAAPPAPGRLKRPVKAMLFADVANFSKIKEWQLSEFLTSYSNFLRDLFASPTGKKAVYANTWGDGLYVVFDEVADAANFASELVEPTVAAPPNWESFDMGTLTPFRIGLHAGPVFELTNLFQGRSEYAGQHVNRAARIEPVTLRGCAYGSEPFAALLMMEAGHRFTIESVGVHSLAKDYDRCPLYHLQRI